MTFEVIRIGVSQQAIFDFLSVFHCNNVYLVLYVSDIGTYLPKL